MIIFQEYTMLQNYNGPRENAKDKNHHRCIDIGKLSSTHNRVMETTMSILILILNLPIQYTVFVDFSLFKIWGNACYVESTMTMKCMCT